MTGVFISCSRKDIAFVRRLYEALEAKDYDAWVDWDDIEYAEDWWAKIQAGIEEANHFVFVISPDSVQSTVCADEVEHATKTFKRIVPLLYHPITAAEDHERMHPSISRHNWLPFSDDDDFDSAIATLIDTLNTNLAISPDERLLASSGFDDTLRLWDIETGEEIRVFEEAGTVLSADFRPDGRYLTWSVSMSMTDDEVVTWDLQEETEAARISVPGVPSDLKYMADSRSIIVALNVGMFDIDTYAVHLDPFTGDEIQQYTGAHDSFVLSVSISVDGRRVLTSGLDTTFYMWNVETGDLLQQFVGHGDEVRDVAFAAGDAIAVSVSVDSTIRFWDVTTGNEMMQFTGHDRDVSNVVVSADGQTVLTGGRDGTMRLWQVPVWDDNLPDQLREARYI